MPTKTTAQTTTWDLTHSKVQSGQADMAKVRRVCRGGMETISHDGDNNTEHSSQRVLVKPKAGWLASVQLHRALGLAGIGQCSGTLGFARSRVQMTRCRAESNGGEGNLNVPLTVFSVDGYRRVTWKNLQASSGGSEMQGKESTDKDGVDRQAQRHIMSKGPDHPQ